MKLINRIMEHPQIYRLWQAPFVEDKFALVVAHNDLRRVRRVLDVGCGPGTNTRCFAGVEYLGVDHNPRYIESARRRYQRDFLLADITKYTVDPNERFDFILLNSVLHHIGTAEVRRLLAHLGNLLTGDGHVHILDLVLPERRSLARFLARLDSGEFPRPLEEWREMFDGLFEQVVFEPFKLTAWGATLWEMVYFKGRARR
jgi:SAM-dependent methyltransferase